MSIRYLASPMLPARQKHANDDERTSDEEEYRDVFRQNQPCKNHGNYGVEVHIVCGDDCPQLSDDPVPSQEAQHGGYAAQKQQVA